MLVSTINHIENTSISWGSVNNGTTGLFSHDADFGVCEAVENQIDCKEGGSQGNVKSSKDDGYALEAIPCEAGVWECRLHQEFGFQGEGNERRLYHSTDDSNYDYEYFEVRPNDGCNTDDLLCNKRFLDDNFCKKERNGEACARVALPEDPNYAEYDRRICEWKKSVEATN